MSSQVLQSALQKLKEGDFRTLSRCISIVENDLEGSLAILSSLSTNNPIPVIGFTGPPGAGKSTLLDALISHLSQQGKKIGVIAVDPTSPFNMGSLLGDRVRMSRHFNEGNVFIRSLATRGSLGGLSSKIIEVCDVMKAAAFDYILVETVGVGQSEVEIAGLADCTILVLVPEAGDEIQQIKSGIMEIGDLFVINKADRPGADTFRKNLFENLRHPGEKIPYERVLKTVASQEEGVKELWENIALALPLIQNSKKEFLLLEKAYRLIRDHRMKDIQRLQLDQQLKEKQKEKNFNFYQWVATYY
jgi:LAO/AO transport system kinase